MFKKVVRCEAKQRNLWLLHKQLKKQTKYVVKAVALRESTAEAVKINPLKITRYLSMAEI
jgi:hypothetical protein